MKTTGKRGSGQTMKWVLVASVAVAVLTVLGLVIYGYMIRSKVVDNPVQAEAEQAAMAVDEKGRPAKGTVRARGDLDLPPVRPPPVDELSDRGREILQVTERRCGRMKKEFQAKVVGEGQCEIYIHALERVDGAILIMASPKYGVMANGRPVSVILPESAYPKAKGG